MRALGAVVCCVLALACKHTEWEARFHAPEEHIPEEMPFLKVHTHRGHVHVLRSWRVEREQERIVGMGLHYDADRRLLDRGRQQVPLPDVVLLETNRPHKAVQAGAPVLGVMGVASAGVSFFCAGAPKACFGSCPTFYAETGEGPALLAEGFSRSIAKVLESTDVDSLHGARGQDGRFDLEMRNEALETHFVRSAEVLAVPADGPVMRAGDRFYEVRAPTPPGRCRADEGDCTDVLAALDGRAYAPPSDPEDLAAGEEVHLRFPARKGRTALVLAGRNSLVQTFLFYGFIARLGADAGRWLSALEREGPAVLERVLALEERIAKIRIDVRESDGSWRHVGDYEEVGPIATDVQLVPLPERASDGPLEVRLRLTRGYWKLDWVNRVALGEPVPAVTLEPRAVVGADGHLAPEEALAALRDRDRHLMTLPGERYVIRYAPPEGPHTLFLRSRGYYYEWQRKEWLEEENPVAAMRFIADPAGELKRLAPAYKEIEHEAERLFWSSRVGPGGGR